MYNIIVYFIIGELGTHGKYSATRQTFAYKGLKKGVNWQGRGQSVIGEFWDSFLQVIDSEAGARMSGHDQIDLIS